jgi:hypothetical protein
LATAVASSAAAVVDALPALAGLLLQAEAVRSTSAAGTPAARGNRIRTICETRYGPQRPADTGES